jgi:hypothetical protein
MATNKMKNNQFSNINVIPQYGGAFHFATNMIQITITTNMKIHNNFVNACLNTTNKNYEATTNITD